MLIPTRNPEAPAEDGTKRPVCRWQEFTRERSSKDKMRTWFIQTQRAGLGLVCGQVSGGLEVLEFDDRTTYEEFKNAAQQSGHGDLVERIEQGYCEDTPSGGVHWLYRCEAVSGNTKLARRPKTEEEKEGDGDRVKVLIETRGERGFIVVAPSGGPVHPSGRPYQLRSGGFDSIATLQPGERTALFNLARSFDEMPRGEAQRPTPASVQGGRPGDDYNQRTTWAEVLEPHEWRSMFTRGDPTHWRRPGKSGPGVSATTNHLGSDLFYESPDLKVGRSSANRHNLRGASSPSVSE